MFLISDIIFGKYWIYENISDDILLIAPAKFRPFVKVLRYWKKLAVYKLAYDSKSDFDA